MTGSNPTDRSKLGTKRHILTDKDGIPLYTVITSANTHDVTVAIDTVDSIIIKRPSSKSITKYRNNTAGSVSGTCSSPVRPRQLSGVVTISCRMPAPPRPPATTPAPASPPSHRSGSRRSSRSPSTRRPWRSPRRTSRPGGAGRRSRRPWAGRRQRQGGSASRKAPEVRQGSMAPLAPDSPAPGSWHSTRKC